MKKNLDANESTNCNWWLLGKSWMMMSIIYFSLNTVWTQSRRDCQQGGISGRYTSVCKSLYWETVFLSGVVGIILFKVARPHEISDTVTLIHHHRSYSLTKGNKSKSIFYWIIPHFSTRFVHAILKIPWIWNVDLKRP